MAEGCGWEKTSRAGFLFFAKQSWHLVMFDQASYIWYFQILQILPPVFFTKCTMSMIWYFSSSGNLMDYNRKSHFHINKLWKAKGVSISFYGQHYTFLVIDNWFLIFPPFLGHNLILTETTCSCWTNQYLGTDRKQPDISAIQLCFKVSSQFSSFLRHQWRNGRGMCLWLAECLWLKRCEDNRDRLERNCEALQTGRHSLRKNALSLELVASDLWHW